MLSLSLSLSLSLFFSLSISLCLSRGVVVGDLAPEMTFFDMNIFFLSFFSFLDLEG